MADDLTDAEDTARNLSGIDNHPLGFLIIRTVRTMRVIITRIKTLEDRVKALEGK